MTARTTLYPGKPKSPVSTLTAPIDDDDTTIPVSELANFDAGPNEASIFLSPNDPETETIKYTDKSAASGAGNLTGVTRAFDSTTAKSWGTGAYIARVLTAYDYNGLVDNQNLIFDEMPSIPLYRQALINGNFDVWQRGTSLDSTTTPANSDDTYLADRWILLSDGNDIVDVSRESTTFPEGSTYALKAEVETANKKFGICQILESVDATKFAGKTVSLSFQAHTPTGSVVENLRAAVISWDGTADTVTSDVVSAWGNEGTNPTLATNWTYENTPTDLALVADTFTTFKIEGISIDTSGMTNLAVFIWVDDTDCAVDDVLRIAQVQLCEGDVALPFQPKSYDTELKDCQRYFERKFPEVANGFICPGMVISTTTAYGFFSYAMKRVPPTISFSSGAGFYIRESSTLVRTTNMASGTVLSTTAGIIIATCSEGLISNQAAYIRTNADTDFIDADAEL